MAELLPEIEGLVTRDASALLGSYCPACREAAFPPAPVCGGCQSDTVETVPLSTTGIVHTWAVVHAPPPGYVGKVPYAVGVVELLDRVRITTTLVADDLDRIRVGRPARFVMIEIDGVLSFAHRVE